MGMRLRALLDTVLLKEDGPLGIVQHFFYRVEFQHLGLPHFHCLFWSADAPAKDSADGYIRDFLDQRITTSSTHDDPELQQLVLDLQIHKVPCTATCSRTNAEGQEYCR